MSMCSLMFRKSMKTVPAIFLCLVFQACKTVPNTEEQMRAYLDQRAMKYYDVSLSPDGRFALDLHEDTEDIRCLSGLPIGLIDISYSKVRDISPLTNCPITVINMFSNLVSDLTPLEKTRLKIICFSPHLTSNTVDCLRRIESLDRINDAITNRFWKMWDNGEHYEPVSVSPSRIWEATRKKKEEIERSWNTVPLVTNDVMEKKD